MKLYLYVILFFVLLGTGCSVISNVSKSNIGQKYVASSPEIIENQAEENAQPEENTIANRQDFVWKKFESGNLGLSFEYPAQFILAENSETGVLVSILGEKDRESGFYLFDLKIYEQATDFSSFAEYADYKENNLIKELVLSSDRGLSEESAIQSELEKYKGRYSFERKNIGGFDVLIHKRDFFGTIGAVYNMDVFMGEGKILEFSSESDPGILFRIYESIKK